MQYPTSAGERGVMNVLVRARDGRSLATRPSPDDNDLGDLFRAEGPRLRRYFRRKTGDNEAAADLVQDAFVRMAMAPTADIAKPAAYLQRIARNLLADRFRNRRARRHDNPVPLDECDLAMPPLQEEISQYEQAMRALGEKTRRVFLLQRIEGMTYEQISVSLGISVATVEYHMMRALAHFDRFLDDL